MSPPRSFRSSVLRFALVLTVVGTKANGFAIRRAENISDDYPQDLAVEESLQLEVKHDFSRPNGVSGNSSIENGEPPAAGDDPTTPTPPPVDAATGGQGFANTVIYNFANEERANGSDGALLDTAAATPNVSVNSILHNETAGNLKDRVLRAQSQTLTNNVTTNLQPTLPKGTPGADGSMSVFIEKIKMSPVSGGDVETSTVFNDVITGGTLTQSNENMSIHANDYHNMRAKDLTTSATDNESNTQNTDSPSWQKYTIMDRRRVSTTDERPVNTEKYDVTNEAVARAAPDDTVMKAAKDWILSTQPGIESTSATTNYPDTTTALYQETVTAPADVPLQKTKFEFVSSKRAGFLNFSSKSKPIEATSESYAAESTSYNDATTPTLENNEEDQTSINVAGVIGSQRYLDEDAIKEELLQETSLNNNEEIANHARDERLNASGSTAAPAERGAAHATHAGADGASPTDAPATEGAFNVKPIQDKGKLVYAVSPNYKPMKKIEVQPPKQFVRDPDDNSWRNESISSLGIVFKPKNSSKPFTQVLKNKTETEWSNLLSRDSKSDVPDLRERLEKIAQKRKTNKKKADLFGNIIYPDYEETNSSEELTSTQNTAYTSTIASTLEDDITTNLTTESVHESFTSSTSGTPKTTAATIVGAVTETSANAVPSASPKMQAEAPNVKLNFTKDKNQKKVKYDPSVIEKGKKYFNIFDYYDASDDDDSEYMELAKLELKKYSAPVRITDAPFTTPSSVTPHQFAVPLTEYLPDRKPTVQYFPPRNTQQPKTNRFDNDFEKKFKSYAKATTPKEAAAVSHVDSPDAPLGKYITRPPAQSRPPSGRHDAFTPDLRSLFKPNEYAEHQRTAAPLVAAELGSTQASTDRNGGYNRASYLVKTYRDFLNQASKDYDYDRDAGLLPYTQRPLLAVTFSDLVKQESERASSNGNFNYDYDAKFRKDVLQRFVDNFNHEDARRGAASPLLYNSTVLHAHAAGGGAVASSRAFLKGLYRPADARREPYDPNCDNVTVELSPAYELHYYVPEQEENEEMEAKAGAAK